MSGGYEKNSNGGLNKASKLANTATPASGMKDILQSLSAPLRYQPSSTSNPISIEHKVAVRTPAVAQAESAGRSKCSPRKGPTAAQANAKRIIQPPITKKAPQEDVEEFYARDEDCSDKNNCKNGFRARSNFKRESVLQLERKERNTTQNQRADPPISSAITGPPRELRSAAVPNLSNPTETSRQAQQSFHITHTKYQSSMSSSRHFSSNLPKGGGSTDEWHEDDGRFPKPDPVPTMQKTYGKNLSSKAPLARSIPAPAKAKDPASRAPPARGHHDTIDLTNDDDDDDELPADDHHTNITDDTSNEDGDNDRLYCGSKARIQQRVQGTMDEEQGPARAYESQSFQLCSVFFGMRLFEGKQQQLEISTDKSRTLSLRLSDTFLPENLPPPAGLKEGKSVLGQGVAIDAKDGESDIEFVHAPQAVEPNLQESHIIHETIPFACIQRAFYGKLHTCTTVEFNDKPLNAFLAIEFNPDNCQGMLKCMKVGCHAFNPSCSLDRTNIKYYNSMPSKYLLFIFSGFMEHEKHTLKNLLDGIKANLTRCNIPFTDLTPEKLDNDIKHFSAVRKQNNEIDRQRIGLTKQLDILVAPVKMLALHSAKHNEYYCKIAQSSHAEKLGEKRKLEVETTLAAKRSRRQKTAATTPIGQRQGDCDTYLVYPFEEDALDAITITKGDIRRLESAQWLNDSLVDLGVRLAVFGVVIADSNQTSIASSASENAPSGMEVDEGSTNPTLLQEARILPSSNSQVHSFNSLFFVKLTEKVSSRNSSLPAPPQNQDISSEYDKYAPARDALSIIQKAAIQHKRVSRWTKSVDIFSKKLVIIPINKNSHWSLVVVLRPDKLEKLADGDIQTGTPQQSQSQTLSESNALESSDSKLQRSAADGHAGSNMKAECPEDSENANSDPLLVDRSGHSPILGDRLRSGSTEKNSDPITLAAEKEIEECFSVLSSETLHGNEADPLPVASQQPIDDAECIILHMDSLGLHSTKELHQSVCLYLLQEFLAKKCDGDYSNPKYRTLRDRLNSDQNKNVPNFNQLVQHLKVPVPQQENGSDCGVFVVKFVESIIEATNHESLLEHSHPKKDKAMLNAARKIFPRDKFSQTNIDEKRSRLRELLENLLKPKYDLCKRGEKERHQKEKEEKKAARASDELKRNDSKQEQDLADADAPVSASPATSAHEQTDGDADTVDGNGMEADSTDLIQAFRSPTAGADADINDGDNSHDSADADADADADKSDAMDVEDIDNGNHHENQDDEELTQSQHHD